MKEVRVAELDPNAGKAKYGYAISSERNAKLIAHRPDHLILHDDPAFTVENMYSVFDMDFSMLEGSSGPLATGSGPEGSKRTPLSGEGGRKQVEGLPSSSAGLGGFGGLDLPESMASSVLRQQAGPPEDEPSFLPDVGFNFDADGNIVEMGDEPTEVAPPGGEQARGVQGESPVSQQLRSELMAAVGGDEQQVSLRYSST